MALLIPERFQSMPIARSGVLWAHVLTSLVANLISLVIVVGVAFLMGFRTGANAGAWFAHIWVALAWCVGILVVAFAFSMVIYRRRIS